MADKVEQIGRQATDDKPQENSSDTETEAEEIIPRKRKSL